MLFERWSDVVRGGLEVGATVVLEADGSLSLVTVDRCRSASAMPPIGPSARSLRGDAVFAPTGSLRPDQSDDTEARR